MCILGGFSKFFQGLVRVFMCAVCFSVGLHPYSPDPVENEACYRAPSGAPLQVVTVCKSAVHEGEK